MKILLNRTETDSVNKSRRHISLRRLWSRGSAQSRARDLNNRVYRFHETHQHQKSYAEDSKGQEVVATHTTTVIDRSRDPFVRCEPGTDGHHCPPDNPLEQNDTESKSLISSAEISISINRLTPNVKDGIKRSVPNPNLFKESTIASHRIQCQGFPVVDTHRPEQAARPNIEPTVNMNKHTVPEPFTFVHHSCHPSDFRPSETKASGEGFAPLQHANKTVSRKKILKTCFLQSKLTFYSNTSDDRG
jgi:hypothetical protein